MKDLAHLQHPSDIAVRTIISQDAWFKTMVHTAKDGIFYVNKEGLILYANEAMTMLLGYSPYEIINQYIFEFCVADDVPLLQAHIHSALDGNAEEFTFRFRNKNKNELPVQLHTRPFREENGYVTGIIGTLTPMSRHQTNQKHETCPECIELNKQKDDFITMASHELKTPLTSIKAFTQILQQTSQRDITTSTVYLEKIENQTNRLMKLINELLDVSKIRAGRFTIMKDWIDFDKLMIDVSAEISQKFSSHTLIKTGNAKQPVFADCDRIRQVIVILVQNAIKYSPHKNVIEMHVSTVNDTVRVDIRDYGIGISEKDQRKLFQPFFRVVNTQEKEVPGLGVGLYLSAEIIRAHEGTITVSSNKGTGSTFSCILPINTSHE